MTTRTSHRLLPAAGLLAALFIAVACGPGGGDIDARIEAQKATVAACEDSLAKETARLQTMRDSLEARVVRNVEIGMAEARARAIEKTLLAAQRAVVDAEAANLRTQREYLALLQKRKATLRGE